MHAEAVALSNAIQLAEHIGVGRVEFETDCINQQRALQSSDYDLSPIGAIIANLKFRLRIGFIEARIVYASHNCNKPAHELAALGVGVAHGDDLLWTTSYPNSATRLVTDDLAVS
jgi:hypothetical protein